MKANGSRNVLYVLVNGEPAEWALARDVPADEDPEDVMVVRFDDVPDDLADQIEQDGELDGVWDELRAGTYSAL